MPSRGTPPGLKPEDFDTIQEAVEETARGRWFLEEYAARLRARETAGLIDSMKRLETAVTASHDEVMARLASALALGEAPAAPRAQTEEAGAELRPRHMKYYRQDEAIFEPAPHAQIAAVPNLAERAREFGEQRPDGQQKRRIVLIRHKPGEAIEVPLADDFAKAS